MRYLPSSPVEDQALLDTIGVPNAEALLAGIPEPLRLRRELTCPPRAPSRKWPGR